MKIVIVGPARVGKDTFAAILGDLYGFTYESSSMFCVRKFLRKQLEDILSKRYESDEACYADRFDHRDLWFDLITAYHANDPGRLTRELLAEFDIYVGCRNRKEFLAAQKEGIFDLAIYLKAPARVDSPKELWNTITEDDCDVIVVNNGGILDLVESAKALRLETK